MDKKWKQWERDVAEFIGGARFAANSGAEIDCEGPTIVAQCKHVKRLGLGELSALASVAEAQGIEKKKLGIVAVKVKNGAGFPSPELIVMTAAMFSRLKHSIR